jgi:hypothetical protein
MIPRKDSKGLVHITVRVSVAKDVHIVQLEMLHAGLVDPLLEKRREFLTVLRPHSWTKSSFPPCYSQYLYNFAFRFIFLQPYPLTVFESTVTVHCKGEKGGELDRKPYPLPYGLRYLYRNMKSDNSLDFARKPHQNCAFMNLASGLASS